MEKSWKKHFVLIWNFLSSCVSESSLPSCLPSVLLPSQRTSRLSGWRRRICSIGGFLCAPTPPPHPKSTPAPSRGTCLMEKTTTSTTSAQVKRPRGQMWRMKMWICVNMIFQCQWWLYLLHLNQQTSYLHISCFEGCHALIVCQQVWWQSSFVCDCVLWVPTRQWDRQGRSLHAE